MDCTFFPPKATSSISSPKANPTNPHSLQQNVGVVAACAPTLKPLVGSWLNLNTTQDYASGGNRGLPADKSGAVGQGGGGASSGEQRDGVFEMGSALRHSKYRHRTTVRGGTSPTSSEERIIEWDDPNGMKAGELKTAVP